ncbi:MAG TPA: hypothetical protein VFP30_05580, partial [Candidatus Limnocylindria bacterium]|nr:hypothetical protein [Candidatus Limnocylindria bacterium]
MPIRLLSAAALALVIGGCAPVDSAPAPCRGDVPPIDETGRPHHDPELERRIHDAIGGDRQTIVSACANATDPGGMTIAPAFLDDLGVELADVSYAERLPDIGGENDAQVTAWRYHSATAADLRTALVSQLHTARESMREAMVGGTSVLVSDGPFMTGTVF